MTGATRLASVASRVRLLLSIATLSAALMWLTHAEMLRADALKCEFHNHPGIGPCDPDQGYVWESVCYDDDGCYTELEDCCGL